MEIQRHQVDLVSKRFDRNLAVLGAVASFATAIGVFCGIYFGSRQIAHQQRQLGDTINAQWGQRYYDNRIEVYRGATTAAARVASLVGQGAPQEEIDEAFVEFKTYYWGPMCLFEASAVERAMAKFKAGVDARITPKSLEQLALKLAHICRLETHKGFFPDEPPASSLGSFEELLAEMDRHLGPAARGTGTKP